MRFLCLFLLLLAAVLPSPARSSHNLDARSRAALAVHSIPQARSDAVPEGQEERYVPLIVDVSDPEGLRWLNDHGAVIFHSRGDLVLCSVPERCLGDVDRTPFIDGATVARAVTPSLDRARAGSGLTDPEFFSVVPPDNDGRDVVVGLCDIGFDPGHIAFRDRIGMISAYNEYSASRSVWAPGTSLHEEGTEAACDTPDESHATHVAGILAGSCRANGYYGAAPGATIAVSLSQCSDVGLLCGIEDIVAYAAELGKPAVINLSMSSYLGPHDGSDLVNRYLDLLGREAVIVFAAGNTGHRPNTLSHTFSSPCDPAGACLESYTSWAGFDVRGMVDIWSADSSRLDFQLIVWDVLERKEVFVSDWISTKAAGSFSIAEACPALWSRLFPDSFLDAFWQTDRYNGRFNLVLSYSVNPVEELPGGNRWARHVVGWRVRGPEGASFTAFTDGITSYLRSYGAPAMHDGDSHLSVSNMSCNHSTVTVGSWNSRASVPVVGAPDRVFPFTENRVSEFSSYGILPDGRSFPHVCAPGNYVVSAASGPWLAAHPDTPVSATVTIDGQPYSWFAECGTSMASPMAAGIIALWLQADPSLTLPDILSLISDTSRFPSGADTADPRWGAGAIDAAAGLRMIAGRSSITSPDLPLFVEVRSHRIHASVGGSAAAITVTDLLGRPADPSATLAPGIYVVSVSERPSYGPLILRIP